MDDNIFKWDHFSDQPYPITDQKYKRKKDPLYLRSSKGVCYQYLCASICSFNNDVFQA